MSRFSRVALGAVVGVLAVAAAGCSVGGQTTGASQPAGGSSGIAAAPTAGAGGATAGPSVPNGSSPSPLATEVNPPGDIPDNQAFVTYRVPGSTVGLKVPEGWSRSTAAGGTTFTSKLNSITVAVDSAAAPPTAASVRARIAQTVAGTVPQYSPGQVSTETRAGGQVFLATYQGDSTADPVTGKVVRDAFEQYTYYRSGTRVTLTLAGPTNADNVDPWRTVSDSVTFA